MAIEEANMSAREENYPIVEGLIGVFGDWLNHRRERGDYDQLDSRTFEDISRDLRLPQGELSALIKLPPHSADELPKLLKVLGFDEADLIRSEPGVLCDMERVCSQCVRKAQCNNDIKTGAAARDYEDYCSNAPTIQALGKSLARR
ncbi:MULTISPECIES: hypothetical protein [Bradyrhizobium]|nr:MULTISPECIES: hypothetical protein [Bradyrhizobium]